jgi:thiol-disulfide isomerase/thioredoxin
LPSLSRPSLIACLPLVCALAIAGCDKAKAPAEQASAGNEAESPASPAGPAAPDAGVLSRDRKGDAMPAMPFAAPGGAPATLTAFRGKPVLVNLWATWCGPCVKELPTLDALAARERGKLQVIAVSQDSTGDAQVGPFWKAHGLKTLTAYTDGKNGLMAALRVDTLPTTILFDAHGKEVWRVAGDKDWTGPDAAKLIGEVQ